MIIEGAEAENIRAGLRKQLAAANRLLEELAKTADDKRPFIDRVIRDVNVTSDNVLIMALHDAEGLSFRILAHEIGRRNLITAAPVLVKGLEDLDHKVRFAVSETLVKLLENNSDLPESFIDLVGQYVFKALNSEEDEGVIEGLWASIIIIIENYDMEEPVKAQSDQFLAWLDERIENSDYKRRTYKNEVRRIYAVEQRTFTAVRDEYLLSKNSSSKIPKMHQVNGLI